MYPPDMFKESVGHKRLSLERTHTNRSSTRFAIFDYTLDLLSASLRPKAAPAGGGLRRKGAQAENQTEAATTTAIQKKC